MGKAVHYQSLEPWITKYYLQPVTGSRVTLEDDTEIGYEVGQHFATALFGISPDAILAFLVGIAGVKISGQIILFSGFIFR
jgi:hypothetical protein